MFDGLMCRPVFAEPDRIVRHHEDWISIIAASPIDGRQGAKLHRNANGLRKGLGTLSLLNFQAA
jgi:hypothetical protein